jgi:hypothetical protein
MRITSFIVFISFLFAASGYCNAFNNESNLSFNYVETIEEEEDRESNFELNQFENSDFVLTGGNDKEDYKRISTQLLSKSLHFHKNHCGIKNLKSTINVASRKIALYLFNCSIVLYA